MKTKRLEIYLWWTCNKKCIFCSEYSVMLDNRERKISNEEVLKKLIFYRKKWYNHVTFLWGEPFIQKNFYFSIKTAKKLWYIVLVTTNGATLHVEKQAEKFLPYIDELFISVNALSKEKYRKIHGVPYYTDYSKVFRNIHKYWRGSFLKINTVINPFNVWDLRDIIEFGWKSWVHEVSLTYPDVYKKFYSPSHKKENIFVRYEYLRSLIWELFQAAEKSWISLKLVDIPFCIFPKEEFLKNTDDYSYENRLKLDEHEKELDRNIVSPRNRLHTINCRWCKYVNTCWWASVEYVKIFWCWEVTPII